MRHNILVMLTGVMVALVLAGCSSVPERELSLRPASYAALPNGHDPLNPGRLSPTYGSTETALALEEGFTRYLERKHGRALNQLSLSGGGQNGAFGAGFLIGWRHDCKGGKCYQSP